MILRVRKSQKSWMKLPNSETRSAPSRTESANMRTERASLWRSKKKGS